MTNFEINLDNKEQASEQLKKIQESFDELFSVCEMQKSQLEENAERMGAAAEEINSLLDSAVNLSDIIKSIHRVLGMKIDRFRNDKEMAEVMNLLAKYVVSPEAIRLGVMSHERNKQ